MNIFTIPATRSLSTKAVVSQADTDFQRACIENLVTKLQADWADYQQCPGGQVQQQLSEATTQLTTELQAITKLATASLPAPEQKALQRISDFALASQMQLQEIRGYLATTGSAPTLSATIPAMELPARKQSFISLKSNGLGEGYRRELECRALLQADGLTLTKVRGDGNCGLRAICMGVFPEAVEDTRIVTLRAELVATMRTEMLKEVRDGTRDGLIATLVNTQLSQEAQRAAVNTYCDRMAKAGTWIGERELRILSLHILKRPIWVYRPDNLRLNNEGRLEPYGLCKHGQDQFPTQAPVRLYHSSSHYQLLS